MADKDKSVCPPKASNYNDATPPDFPENGEPAYNNDENSKLVCRTEPAAPAAEVNHKIQKKYNYRNIDKSKIVDLYFLKKVSITDIAKVLDCSPAYIFSVIKPFRNLLADDSTLQAFEKNKSKILTTAEMKILNELLRDDKLKEASANNLAYAFQQMFNANRLEKNQSTQNIAVVTQSAAQYSNFIDTNNDNSDKNEENQ